MKCFLGIKALENIYVKACVPHLSTTAPKALADVIIQETHFGDSSERVFAFLVEIFAAFPPERVTSVSTRGY